MASAQGDVTQLLVAWCDGADEEALARLMPLVYDELRSLASAHLRRERPDHTLQPTALVHEAYLRLVDQRQVRCHNRRHFFAAAAQAMRRVLVDHARRTLQLKRGGGVRPVSLEEGLTLAPERAGELIALDEALEDLAAIDGRQARIVELRFFGGLTSEEIASLLGLSIPTVTRGWRMARAWLFHHLTEGSRSGA